MRCDVWEDVWHGEDHGLPAERPEATEDVAEGAYRLETFTIEDFREALDILEQYRDLNLGLADASVVVLARRYGIHDVLTLDERHFRAVLGPGGRPFRILPADATAA